MRPTRTLPLRAPNPTPNLATGDGPAARTAPLPPAAVKAPARRAWAGVLALLAAVAVASAGFTAWRIFFGGSAAAAASITLIAPAPVFLRPGEKATVHFRVERKKFADAATLTGTAPPRVTVRWATIPAGADAVDVEIEAASTPIRSRATSTSTPPSALWGATPICPSPSSAGPPSSCRTGSGRWATKATASTPASSRIGEERRRNSCCSGPKVRATRRRSTS